ncbi:MAG: hypothetical protein ABIT76_14205 [Chthoniobacterales bacterium]
MGPLNRVEAANLNADFHFKTPLRSLRDVPEMPLLRRLVIEPVATLDGLERYPKLVNLEVDGFYRDLTPLAALPEVTSLKLNGNLFTDLAPVCRMGGLRKLEMEREHPLDISVLAEAPELREVLMPRCPIMATELTALQAALVPWSMDFTIDPPRALEPLRFVVYSRQDEEMKRVREAKQLKSNEEYHRRVATEDAALRAAEGKWFEEEIYQRLNRLLGPGWGIPNGNHVPVRRYADVMRFREIVQVLREISAMCRKPANYLLIIEPHGDMSEDMDRMRLRNGEETADWLLKPFDAAQEKEEWENFRKGRLEQREFLEREHRMRLQQQGGMEINPAEFAHKEEAIPKEKIAAGDVPDGVEDDEDFQESEGDWNDDGGLMLPPPDDETSEMAQDLGFYAVLLENTLLVASSHDERENATYFMGEEPLEWSDLPEPPEERPLPVF